MQSRLGVVAPSIGVNRPIHRNALLSKVGVPACLTHSTCPIVPFTRMPHRTHFGRKVNQTRCRGSREESVEEALIRAIESEEQEEEEDGNDTGFSRKLDPEWADWLHSMKEAYQLGIYKKHIVEQLNGAISSEDFEAAARYKDIVMSLEKDDIVHKLKKDLGSAIDEERFADAAHLRDASHTSLEGWWVAREKDDPCGQLVHITSEFSRYVGTAYSTKEIAEAQGWMNVDAGSSPDRPDDRMLEMGRTALEVYLRKNNDEQTAHQACVLKARTPAFSSENIDGTLKLSDVESEVSFGKGDGENGGTLEVKLKLNSKAFKSGDSNIFKIQKEDKNAPNEEHTIDPKWDISGKLDASSSILYDWTTGSTNEEATSNGSEDELPDNEVELDAEYEDEEVPDADLYRVRAGLNWIDRNHFYLEIDKDTGPQTVVPEPWGRSNAEQEYAPGMSNPGIGMSREEFKRAVAMSKSKISELLQEAVGRALSETQLEGAVENFMVAGQQGQEEILQMLEGELGGTDTEELSSRIAESLIEKFCKDLGFEDRVSFSRIPMSIPKTDPFSGLYLGAFGPHGPELLLVRRIPQNDGSDMVEGVKLTGDPHVPAGEVSFRVRVGRKHRLDSRDKYPEQLGIIARYPGEGRVADVGFSDPRWVSGEFLQFHQSGGSMLTGGAELGFVWAVPGARRFLILLQRLNLEA